MQEVTPRSDRPRRRREDLALSWLLGTDPRAAPSLARLAGEAAGGAAALGVGLAPLSSSGDAAVPPEASLPDAWMRLWRRAMLPEQLIAFHEELASATNAADCCETLARHAARIVGAYHALVLLPDPAEEGALRVAGQWSHGAEPLELAVRPEALRRAPCLVDPAALEAGDPSGAGLSVLARTPGVSTLALVPLGTGGLLVLVERRAERIFIADDWKVLEALASHTRRALDSASALAEARTAALVDPLTGLANRRHLEVALHHAWAGAERGESLTVMLLDLDDFKGINDRHGHATGDDILRVVGEVLRSETRGADAVVRYGGDEFLVVLPRADEASARTLFARVRDRLRGWVGITAGVAEFHPSHTTPADLIAAADEDLYARKRRRGPPQALAAG